MRLNAFKSARQNSKQFFIIIIFFYFFLQKLPLSSHKLCYCTRKSLEKLALFLKFFVPNRPQQKNNNKKSYVFQAIIAERKLVSRCFELTQPHRITSGMNTNVNFQVIHFTSHHTTSYLFSLFIFRGHSTWEPAYDRVIYFILRAYAGTMC